MLDTILSLMKHIVCPKSPHDWRQLSCWSQSRQKYPVIWSFFWHLYSKCFVNINNLSVQNDLYLNLPYINYLRPTQHNNANNYICQCCKGDDISQKWTTESFTLQTSCWVCESHRNWIYFRQNSHEIFIKGSSMRKSCELVPN